ncbi:MAG: aspartyl protease family protein [Planctomycetota bacterium]|nr:aspartyl protease family protein [Planctomycetota bacterium]
MSAPVVIALERYQDALPAVRVDVAGTQRLFLFDTGAGITCVAPALAAELEAEPYGKLVGLRMNGESLELQRVDAVALAVGGIPLVPPMVGVLDLAALLPEGWPPVDGVLALDAFVHRPLTLDLAARTLVLESESSARERARAGDEVEIRVSRPVQGHAREVFVAARLDGRTWWLELDTGNAAPVLLAVHTGVEDDGEITLELGGAPWTGAFYLQEMILDGNLGQTFCAGRAITLDLAHERMFVAPSSAPTT